MKLTFLGTGAADWDITEYKPGTFHRRFSSAWVNDDLLIDPGPHIFHYAYSAGTPGMFDRVKNIIVTHTHPDHFCPETVERLCLDKDVTLWGDDACLRKLASSLGVDKASRIRFSGIKVSREAYRISDYSVWSLRSNHATDDADEITRLYLIGDGERMLYYGCDSSWIPTPSWNVIKTKPINTMVLECTCGETAPDDWRIFEHNTLDMLEAMLRMFRKYDCFAGDVKYFVSHMARTLHTDHETLEKHLRTFSVTPAYDGMTVEV